MNKIYRVQDLASYDRKVIVDGQEVQFDGHYAIVPDSIIYYFERIDDYQVGKPQIVKPVLEQLADTLGYKQSPVIETVAVDAKPTVSPNIEKVTKDNTSEIKSTKIPVDSGKKRASWN